MDQSGFVAEINTDFSTKLMVSFPPVAGPYLLNASCKLFVCEVREGGLEAVGYHFQPPLRPQRDRVLHHFTLLAKKLAR